MRLLSGAGLGTRPPTVQICPPSQRLATYLETICEELGDLSPSQQPVTSPPVPHRPILTILVFLGFWSFLRVTSRDKPTEES